MTDNELGEGHLLALHFLDQCDSLFDYARDKADIEVCVGLAKSALAITISAAINYGVKNASSLAVVWFYRLLHLKEDGARDTSKTINWAKPLMDQLYAGNNTALKKRTVRRSTTVESRFRVEAGVQTKIDVTLMSQRNSYRIRAATVAAVVGLIAAICAYKWPLHGNHVQANFFLSLTSSLITLLGIVFTLFLVGSQLAATRTNISLRRVFGTMAWLYLLLFVATTLWTLALSYRAGNTYDPARVCPTLFGVRAGCISEVFAGRLGIFGLVASLVLLPVFISYVYRRLTPSYSFSTLAISSLHARSDKRLKSRSEQLWREIVSALPDTHAAKEGVGYLLELGALSATRRQSRRRPSSYERATLVTSMLRDLVTHPDSTTLRVSALDAFETWSKWLISHVRIADIYPPQRHRLEGKQVASLVREARDCIQEELSKWRDGDNSSDIAQRCINSMIEIARSCKPHPLHIYMTSIAGEIGDCAVRKAIDGSASDFNLALRGLISLCHACSLPNSRHLNGGGVFRQLTLAVESLGQFNDARKTIPRWTLTELHNLTDGLSMRRDFDAEVWRRHIHSIASLNSKEISGIIVTPNDPKQHRFKGAAHSSWQSEIFQALDASDDQPGTYRRVVDDATRSWVRDRDLQALTSQFSKFQSRYRQDYNDDTVFLLIAVAAYVRHCYQGDWL